MIMWIMNLLKKLVDVIWHYFIFVIDNLLQFYILLLVYFGFKV